MNSLGTFLNRLHERYHRSALLSSDPLEFVWKYSDPLDQEAVALLAALLAYGNVKQIRRSISGALARMERLAGSPSEFVRKLRAPAFRRKAERGFEDWVHRFNTGRDFLNLLSLLSATWERHGSLGAHFVAGLGPDDADFSRALDRLIEEWRAELGPDASPGSLFFLNAPGQGGCCKRWCMFLRWMGRQDELDPGLWARGGALQVRFPNRAGGVSGFLKPAQLVIPLDTHVSRISRYLGLTRRKSTDWKAAVEVTESLRRFDPVDPVRYDFALARLGILDVCSGKFSRETCGRCELRDACQVSRSGVARISKGRPCVRS